METIMRTAANVKTLPQPRAVHATPAIAAVETDSYESAFRENEIDDTVLPNLTGEDLKDLGVSIVGHRPKLLDAIAALRADTEPKTAPDIRRAAQLRRLDWTTTDRPWNVEMEADGETARARCHQPSRRPAYW
jgi:hypothetical protein